MTPEKDTHRNWLIEQNWLGQWEATHPDFDGLEDNRYVRGRTRDEVIEEIENWIEENE